jgi:hypothetical protein
MGDFWETLKKGDYYNAGSGLIMQDADGNKLTGRKIHDKLARRLIRRHSLKNVWFARRKKLGVGDGQGNRREFQSNVDMRDKLQEIWFLKGEARKNSTNSHEAKRLFAAELADRRKRRP